MGERETIGAAKPGDQEVEADELGVVWVATSGSFQFRGGFHAEKSRIDQTRGCERGLIILGVQKGSFMAYRQPLDTKNGIPD